MGTTESKRKKDIKYHADDPCFGFIDFKFLFCVSVSVRSVAVHIFTEFHSLDDGEPQVLRDCFGFLLCDSSEGIEKHLIPEGQRVDAFLFELDADTGMLEFSGIL